MINFYNLPETVRIIINMLTVISAGFAGLVLVLHQYRFKHGFTYWMNSAAAFLALCQTVINAALIAQVYLNVSEGFVVASEHIIARYVVFAAVTAVFIVLLIKRKPFLSGVVVAASFLTLPVMETWTGNAFPIAFSASLVILLVSGVWLTVKIRRELTTSISSLSVKQAMDSLDSAVLFYRKNGHILMQNSKMQELMLQCAGRVLYNGKMCLETVIIPNSQSNGNGSYLYRFPDSVWLFTVSEIKAGKKTVTRITGTDVTEQDRAAVLLKERHDELEAKRERLKDLVENIEETCRSENLLRIKTELHDAHNQKLTTLLQVLRHGELPENESFDTLSESVLRGIKEPKTAPADPKIMLDTLVNQYSRKGVKIGLTGDLPAPRDFALTFVQILQEAAANAVLHGYANEITVCFMAGGGKHTMRVTDNGTRFPVKIKEGSGIAGMRRCVETFGGKLSIDVSPHITLTAVIPCKEGEENG